MVDWNNLNLDNDYDRSLYLLEPIVIDTLLLEIDCNLEEINADTITAQFEESLEQKIQESRDIFKANLENFVNKARKVRAMP
jgi:formiminotetrahydrofolate cyclodeaminase